MVSSGVSCFIMSLPSSCQCVECLQRYNHNDEMGGAQWALGLFSLVFPVSTVSIVLILPSATHGCRYTYHHTMLGSLTSVRNAKT